MTLEPGDPRHGTLNGYNKRGCRCTSCRAAKASYQVEYLRTHDEQRAAKVARDAAAYRAKRAAR